MRRARSFVLPALALALVAGACTSDDTGGATARRGRPPRPARATTGATATGPTTGATGETGRGDRRHGQLRAAHDRDDRPAAEGVGPRRGAVPARRVAVRQLLARHAHRSVPGRGHGLARERRLAHAHGVDPVRRLPARDRRGPAVVADGCARGAGDRGAELRARVDGLDRRGGDARRADLLDVLVPGLPGDPARCRRATSDAGTARCARRAARSSSTRGVPPRRSTSRHRTGRRTATRTCSAATRCRTCDR